MIGVLGPALFAAAVAVAATVVVERFGGRVGGVLATLPTTVVPASWGMWSAGEGFTEALGMVPVGMLVNAGFLAAWRFLPPSLPPGSLGFRLGAMVTVSLCVWAVLAGLVVVARDHVPVSAFALGGAAWALTLLVGVAAARGVAAAPMVRRPTSLWVLASRGLLAGISIGAASLLARSGDPVLAAMASVFPSIFLTTMVSLWWSRGEALPASAVGPMMLGSASVSGYALVACLTFPALGPLGGTLAAWGLAVAGVSFPAARWVAGR